ncbi:hypothetical protein ACQY0O_007738 [Thecaphora frezii]
MSNSGTFSGLKAITKAKQASVDRFKSAVNDASHTGNAPNAIKAAHELNKSTNDAAHAFKAVNNSLKESVRPGHNAGMRQAMADYNRTNDSQARTIKEVVSAYKGSSSPSDASAKVDTVRQHFSRSNEVQARGLRSTSQAAAKSGGGKGKGGRA